MSQLTPTQIQDLKYLYEEEKLARDVYAKLFERWGIQAFSNIGSTEERHIEAVKMLAESYNVEVSEQLPIGQFSHAELQKSYDDLIAKGMQSPEAALKVGAYIEELDIADINKMTTDSVSVDMREIFNWLNLGSRNHLRGFVRTMRFHGIDYQPQLLSQVEYNAIINSPHERGGRGSQCHHHHHRNAGLGKFNQ
jgi:hypothetical protein